MAQFYLGGPIWGVKKWLGSFFPKGTAARDFLSVYSRRLSTVEGNSSFYALPSIEQVERWRAETPPGFRFCFKFPRRISHDAMLRGCDQDTEAFLRCIDALQDRAGPSFLQLPPQFSPAQLPVLDQYLAALPLRYRVAVEVRHPAFFAPGPEAALDALLTRHQVARVLMDVRGVKSAQDPDADTLAAQQKKPDVPVRFLRTAPFTMVRYISHPDPAHNAPLLEEWAAHLARWLQEGMEVFFCLHYPGDLHVPTLCRDLHQRLHARVPLPALPPWAPVAQAPAQISLF